VEGPKKTKQCFISVDAQLHILTSTRTQTK